MAYTTNRLLCSKSLLHHFVISPLPRLCSTDTECSKLVQTDFHNLRTESKPPKLSEIFKQHRYQLPAPNTHTSFRLDTKIQLDKALNILKIECDPQKLVQIFKQLAEQPSFCGLRSPYEIIVKKLAFTKQFDAIEEILDHSLQMSRFESKDDRRGRQNDDDVLLGMQPPRPTATCQTSTTPSMGVNPDLIPSKKWERSVFMNTGPGVYSPSRLTHLGSYPKKTSANMSRENTVVPAVVSQPPADEGSRTGLKGSSLANLMNNSPSATATRNTSGQSLSAGSSKFLSGNGVQESSIPSSPQGVASASRQLTIFYAGQAHVFDDIHPSKADAILTLAGSNGRSWSTTYSPRPRSTLQALATEGNILSVEREKVGNRMATINSSSGLDMPLELQALVPARTHAGQGNSRLGTNFVQFTPQNVPAAIGGNGHKDRPLMACPSTCSNEGDKETICNSQQLA